jgi:hypothetical protein
MVHRFFNKEGKLINIPRKKQAKLEIFTKISQSFEEEKVYSEKEVNQILQMFYEDFAILRRYLVDYGFLKRDLYGTAYKKVELSKSE